MLVRRDLKREHSGIHRSDLSVIALYALSAPVDAYAEIAPLKPLYALLYFFYGYRSLSHAPSPCRYVVGIRPLYSSGIFACNGKMQRRQLRYIAPPKSTANAQIAQTGLAGNIYRIYCAPLHLFLS